MEKKEIKLLETKLKRRKSWACYWVHNIMTKELFASSYMKKH